jgi:hypothetical protein
MISGNGQEELRKLIGQLNELGKGRAMAPLTTAVAHEAIVRIKGCFDRSTDPYGEAWAPTMRGGRIQLDTARLRNAFLDNSRPGVVEINNPTKYAAQRNYGGRIEAKSRPYLRFQYGPRGSQKWAQKKSVFQPARKFIPDERGLPADWERRFEAVARLTLEKVYGLK